MVNKTKFYKTKVALAVVLSLGLAACGDSDGDVATSNNTADASQPTEVNQVAKGSIQGVVLDTNGQPVVGATITTAGKTATTDTSGSYIFADLPVSNVAGADDDTSNNAFTIVIQAPTGYASTATVEVLPSAQVDAENNTDVGTPLTTFIDGFLATAPTAVMPKMESSIEGVIRNEITGEPVVNAKVVLDFLELSTTLNVTDANTSLSGETVYVMTDDDGHFMFENVSNDSSFDLSISGYSFTADGQTKAALGVTTAEQVEQWVGTLTVSKNSSSDTLPPFIASVNSSIGAATDAYNMLEPGFDGTTGIVFNMSEAVSQTIDATNVSVWSETLGAYKTVASVEQTATTLTVTLTDAIAAGEKVQVLFQMNEIRDGAGNLFTVTEPGTDLTYTAANASQTTYAQVRLQGHFVADTGAAIALVQVWSEDTVDAYEDSTTKVDGVNRLNDDEDDSASRMQNRLDAEDDGTVNNSNALKPVDSTTATIEIDQTAGEYYNLSMPAGAVLGDVKDADGVDVPVASWTDGSLDEDYLILLNVSVDDKVSVTPLDDFGNPGTKQTITLVDNVPATTALQESYGLAEISPLVFGDDVDTVIDGGENSVNGAAGTAGDPLIYVSPRLLAGSDASWEDDVNDAVNGNQIFSGLGGLPTAETLGNAVVPADIVSQAYTASQWAEFAATPIKATFGIAFTEEVSTTGTPLWAGTSTLTDWASGVDTATSNDTNSVLVDSNFVGLTVTTNDVLTLGNVDANNAEANAIDFTDVVADKASNNSGVDSKARVAFVDALPPFVTSASFAIDELTVEFNESIEGDNWKTQAQTMILSDHTGATITLSAGDAGYAADDVTLSEDGKTVTFSNENLTPIQFTALTEIFSNGSIDTALDQSELDDSYDFEENDTMRGHANLDFKGVSDANTDGNIWSNYQDGTYAYNNGALTMNVTPVFMAWSLIPEFDATLNLASGANGDVEFTLTLTTGSGLAFDLDETFVQAYNNLTNITNDAVEDGPLVLTGDQVDDLFIVSGAQNIIPGSSGGLISQGGTAMSFTITFNAPLVTDDTITLDSANVLDFANQAVDTLGRKDAVQAVVVPLN